MDGGDLEGGIWGMCIRKLCDTPSVRAIGNDAFEDCSNLTYVHFCDEIEEFVSGESMQHWWNHRVHEKCLSTDCFLAQFNIPERLGLVR